MTSIPGLESDGLWGTYELKAAQYPTCVLSFVGIPENVHVPATPAWEERWEDVLGQIGREFQVGCLRSDGDLVLDKLVFVADSDERIKLRQDEQVAREKVIKAALMCASDQWDQQAEDPGWQSEYNDDMLRDATMEFATAIRRRRAANA